MSILIKGMEMPTSCGECELCACYVLEDGTEENYRCPITMYPIHDFGERHERCPLVPVPPHGDLIEQSAWRTKAVMDFCREHHVTIIVENEWKTREKKVELRKGKYTVIRRICYDAIPTILPTLLLKEMLQEIPAESEVDDGEVR